MRSVPLRSFSDFLGPGARFSVPRESKWNERVISNLIYYQSNYFLLGLVIVILLSALNPVLVLTGLLVICLPLAILLFLDIQTLNTINQPKILVPACVVISVLLIRFISGIILLFCILLVPVLSIFLHALCRQRNLKNKVCKLVESVRVGEQKTLMGYILEVFGVDVRLLSIDN
ncbi:PRA1 family protein isoform 2 [Schistosoma japonicum]|uniref:PRA1 family protein n=1 Tax=Schistosoma japonicum TaxID=6182 RepID=Q5DES6_SCHJA|nr:SJCHGC08978 protein [Schistosoma japonicum]TNN17929.1 PRA1 family protein isoform 2 [Schistosoma japonicum]TNN17930.1 PRA1 family protein isoform 2 [Schistosoma japonicum]CAX69520.1 PRA1 family protein 3 [Schistosoma japonicum]